MREQLKDFLDIGIARAEGFGVADAAGRAAVGGERFFGALGAVGFARIVRLVADDGHLAAEPFVGLSPLVGDIDESIGGEVDGVAGAVVELKDAVGRFETLAAEEQAVAVAQGRLRDLRGDFVIGVGVLWPEHEGDIGADLGDGVGH